MRRTVCGILVLACVGLVGATAFGEEVDNPVYKAWASHKVGTKVTMKTTADFGGNANESTSTQQLMAVTPEKVTIETTRTGGFGGGGGGGAPPATSMDIMAKIDKAQIGVAPNAFGRGGGGRGRRGGAGAPGGAATPPPAPPAPTDMKTGTEKVDVLGKSEDATTYEYSMAMGFGGRRGGGAPGGAAPGGAAPADGAAPAAAPTTKVKTWYVTDVPGGLVKSETKGSFGQGDFTSTSTISKVEEGNGTATPAPAPAAQ